MSGADDRERERERERDGEAGVVERMCGARFDGNGKRRWEGVGDRVVPARGATDERREVLARREALGRCEAEADLISVRSSSSISLSASST